MGYMEHVLKPFVISIRLERHSKFLISLTNQSLMRKQEGSSRPTPISNLLLGVMLRSVGDYLGFAFRLFVLPWITLNAVRFERKLSTCSAILFLINLIVLRSTLHLGR